MVHSLQPMVSNYILDAYTSYSPWWRSWYRYTWFIYHLQGLLIYLCLLVYENIDICQLAHVINLRFYLVSIHAGYTSVNIVLEYFMAIYCMLMSWPTCPFFKFDYVILWLCLLVNLSYVILWLCFPNIYMSIFSLFYILISSNFKLYFILKDQWNQFIFKNRGNFFPFCFAPCAPRFPRWCIHIVISSEVLCRLCCHLFERVALLLLSFPLCFEPYLLTPSLCFVQSTGAFTSSITFHWHAWSSWPQFLTVSLAVCSRMFPGCSQSFSM